MSIYFWSDTHFNHQRAIEYCNRPYKTVREMNEGLITLWNSVISPKDVVYHLGDFGFSHPKGQPLNEIFERLNGWKHLIVGNHDEKNPKVLKLAWASMSTLQTIRDSGRKIIICHYPLESWKGAFKGYVHLHGHCHGLLKRKLPRRYDVGVDVEMVPVSFEDVFLRAVMQLPEEVDGHVVEL